MNQLMPSVHEKKKIVIEDLGIHGEGIGHDNGFVIFVPGALPEETVEIEIVKVKKSYAIGKLISIENPSSERVQPHCPVYDICGGCQISHMSYMAQLVWKEKRVRDAVKRIGGEDPLKVLPILGALHSFHYRNKMAVPCGEKNGHLTMGYYRQGSHEIADMNACDIQEEENNRLLAFAKSFAQKHGISGYNEKTGNGVLRHVMGRVGNNGKVMAVIVTATKKLPFEKEWISGIQKELPEVVSIYHNVQDKKTNVILGKSMRLLAGAPTLASSMGDLSFEVSPFSFFQVHKSQAEVLYERALSFASLTGGETVIDAYCGTGTISLYLAKKARKVIGIEIVPAAIEDAKKNAKQNHIENAEFHAADAGKYMPRLYQEGLRPDVIVMDPVRAGCSPEVLRAAAGMKPKRIVYVSCNPATFARDLALLKLMGYTAKKIQPVDMFPQTTHVELVSLIEPIIEEEDSTMPRHYSQIRPSFNPCVNGGCQV